MIGKTQSRRGKFGRINYYTEKEEGQPRRCDCSARQSKTRIKNKKSKKVFLPASVLPPLHRDVGRICRTRGGTPRIFGVVDPRLVGEPFLLRSGGSWLLTWYPHDPTTGGLDYHGSAGASCRRRRVGQSSLLHL